LNQNITKNNYLSHILKIAIPVSLQSLFASSLSVIDQIMVGRLGETDIASVSLAGRFVTVFFFTVGAIAVGASILISQFRGKVDNERISKAFVVSLKWGLLLTAVFFLTSFFFSPFLMTLFSPDFSVRTIGSSYLKIVTIGFFPGFLTMMVSTYLRSTGKPIFPSIASISAMVINTILNFILIFGYFGFPALGVTGAAIATTIARFVELIVVLWFFFVHQRKSEFQLSFRVNIDKAFRKIALAVTLPIFFSELAWSLGEAVYGIIYGHIGTDEMAAMSLIGPMIMLSIGLFAGLSQAVSILVGTELGKGDYSTGIFLANRSIRIGIVGTLIIGGILIGFAWIYPNLYAIEASTKATTTSLLIAFSCVLWVKVSNMILGGILKSGGKTHYVFLLDLLGTWFIGIPLGFLSAFVFGLPIHYVYLLIALEELVRFIIGYQIFRSGRWIKTI